PGISQNSRALKLTFALCFAVLLLKEFAPAALFGSTLWRRLAIGSFQIALPWTHNPSPVRAFEAIVSAGVAVLWFFWVRTLAAEPGGDRRIAWAMLVAGGAVGAVSLAVGHVTGDAIYGIRPTPGYHGFGPFPNRNHTATFLAMSALI